MHYRFLVTLNKEEASDSTEARDYVSDYLESNGFVHENLRWNGAPADWFVIGGRWSGILTTSLLPKDKVQAFEKEFEKNYGWRISKDISAEQRRAEAQELFSKYFPDFKGELPYWRDKYKVDGFEDDAMIVTKELYENLLKQYEGSEESENHCDIGYNNVSPEFIGKKWVVVVDYHN